MFIRQSITWTPVRRGRVVVTKRSPVPTSSDDGLYAYPGNKEYFYYYLWSLNLIIQYCRHIFLLSKYPGMQLLCITPLPSKERYGVFKSRLWSQLGLPMEFGERRFVIGNNSNYKARRARPYATNIVSTRTH